MNIKKKRKTGWKLSEEHKKKISEYAKKRKQSPETVKKRVLKMSGSKNYNWKGGTRIDREGYVCIHSPTHPNKDKNKLVREHRLIMEKHIGRTLTLLEIVHHINGDRQDNRIENLMLFAGQREHSSHHWKIRKSLPEAPSQQGVT